jgi:hypothetical protein
LADRANRTAKPAARAGFIRDVFSIEKCSWDVKKEEGGRDSTGRGGTLAARLWPAIEHDKMTVA